MFPDRSPRIRHRNELTERDWENAVRGLGFRAEKRSAQASAHPLSQAHGGLFFDCVRSTVCLFVTERVTD